MMRMKRMRMMMMMMTRMMRRMKMMMGWGILGGRGWEVGRGGMGGRKDGIGLILNERARKRVGSWPGVGSLGGLGFLDLKR